MKKPWFIWLSMFGFFWLFAFLGFKQIYIFVKNRSIDLAQWASFAWHSIGLMFPVLLPALLIIPLAGDLFAENSAAWYIALSCLWVYIYFIGVFMNLHLYRWAKNRGVI